MKGFASRAIPNLVVFLSGLAIMLLELVASRLIANHLGSSLETWTTVIGVILAGMSLGNYWGGRLADLRDPLEILPYQLGGSALLCAGVLWMNDVVGGSEWIAALPQSVRIVTAIALVFFLPACVLGTITPVVARWAIRLVTRTGAAIGNVSAWSTAGNILGTFLTGYYLLLHFGVRSILLTAVGVLATTAAGLLMMRLSFAPDSTVEPRLEQRSKPEARQLDASTLWTRALPNSFVFTTGMSIMIVELVGSRMLAREAGSSIYTWTSLIGVILLGVTVGNFVGGLLADRFSPPKLLPHLFLIASIAVTSLLASDRLLKAPEEGDLLHGLSLPQRIIAGVFIVFFAPPCALATISPVVAKLALERAQKAGAAIGNVYAWGAIGSIAGTFFTGFLLISWLGTKAVLCAVAGLLAVISVCMMTSGLGHAVWAGILMALCIAVAAPRSWGPLGQMAEKWKLREVIDEDEYRRESNYYTIKVYPPRSDGSRTLVLDNLIHGYVVKDNPRKLKYDYELIYSAIIERAGAIPAPEDPPEDGGSPLRTRPLRTLFLGGGSYTYQRYIGACYPNSKILVAEIDPGVTRAVHEALYLPEEATRTRWGEVQTIPADSTLETRWGDARYTLDLLLAENRRATAVGQPKPHEFDFVIGDAFNDFSVPWHLTTREFNQKIKELLTPNGVYLINIIDNYKYSKFLGAYVNTARKSFDGVEVFCTAEGGAPSENRETFVIAMSRQAMDFEEMGSRPGERPLEGSHLDPLQVEKAVERANRVVLTDDYAPVENLLEPVARDR